MATEFPFDDAVRALQALTRVLETIAQDLHAWTVRSDAWAVRSARWMRWHCWLLGVLLLASVGMFVVGARTHATQTEALRQVMQENRAIFERLTR